MIELRVGQIASAEKTFTREEVAAFSRQSLDTNPIHLDAEYASQTQFGRCIVQGPFVASMFGGLLGSRLPGPGTIYIQQTTRFLKPAFVGERIRINVEITDVRTDKPIIRLRTWATDEAGDLIIDGEAVVKHLTANVPPQSEQ